MNVNIIVASTSIVIVDIVIIIVIDVVLDTIGPFCNGADSLARSSPSKRIDLLAHPATPNS